MEFKTNYTKEEKEYIESIGPVGSGCTIEIQSHIKVIPREIFNNCNFLKSVTLPNSITCIDFKAFFNCTSLKEIVIPDSVEEIGVSAFCECKSLEKVKLSNSIEKICRIAFSNCTSLKNIDLPNSIKYLEPHVFAGCTSLKKIVIPASIEYINCFHFQNTSLEEIIIKSNNQLSEDLLYYCNSAKKIYITKKAYSKSLNFIKNCKAGKIEIEIIDKSLEDILKEKTLDDLLDEGKSLKELSKLYKEYR